jgi:hypothetical protein
MIKKYVNDLSAEMGIKLKKIAVVDGRDVGCLSVSLLHLSAADQLVSVLVHQSELDDLQKNITCDRLELKVRSALSRLQVKMEL